MKVKPMTLGQAIFMLLAGAILGTVFTFGMQYWNAEVSREDCRGIETQFVSYEECRGKYNRLQEIAVDCANGERYFVDGVSLSESFIQWISRLPQGKSIILLIHPHQNKIVELSCDDDIVLGFEDTIDRLQGEATGFLYLGIFLYFCAVAGLYYVIYNCRRREK